MQLAQPSVDRTMRFPARVKFRLTTTADEDETSEGNPGNSNGDAVYVVPPPGRHGGTRTTWTHSAKRTEIGNSSTRPMPPKRTACYQQREWQHMHFLGKTLPSH